jgi:hypothetical protein
MPIWLVVESDKSNKIHYPASTVPTDFGCNQVEVQHNNIIDMEVLRTATTKIEEHEREIVKAQNSHRTATEATEIASDDKTKRLN